MALEMDETQVLPTVGAQPSFGGAVDVTSETVYLSGSGLEVDIHSRMQQTGRSFADILFAEGIILKKERKETFKDTNFSANLFSSGISLAPLPGAGGGSGKEKDSEEEDSVPWWKRWWVWVLAAVIIISGFFFIWNALSSEKTEITQQSEEIIELQSGLTKAEQAKKDAEAKAEKERLAQEEADRKAQEAKEAEARAEEERLAEEQAQAEADAELRAQEEADRKAEEERQAEEKALAGYVTIEVQSPQAGVVEHNINGASNVDDFTGKWVREIAIRELTAPITIKVTSSDEGTPVSCQIKERKDVVSTGRPLGSTNTATCTYTFKR